MPDDHAGTGRDASLEMLAARAASNPDDREAFGELYDATHGRVYAYVRARVEIDAIAEDLTEGVYLDALAAIGRYRARDGGILAWLLRIARNDVLDHARRARVRQISSLDEVASQVDPGATPEEHIVARDEHARLRTAVEGLPERQREVIWMRFASGLGVTETARAMGVSISAVKSLQFRAMTNLQEILRDA